MAKDLGTKFTCYNCEAKFYDMKKPAPICPKCGADQREMPATKTPERKRAAASKLEAVEEEDTLKVPDAEEDEEEDEEEEVEADE
jgi:uncharacterized protein (TIGR02300 family)